MASQAACGAATPAMVSTLSTPPRQAPSSKHSSGSDVPLVALPIAAAVGAEPGPQRHHYMTKVAVPISPCLWSTTTTISPF
jgi:hypothetical protein